MAVSGVYEIYCIPLDRSYVGCSLDVGRRYARIRHELKKGIFGNFSLQKAWNTYGEDEFDWNLLERNSMDVGKWRNSRRTF